MAKPAKLTENLGTANAILVANQFGNSLKGLLDALGVHRRLPLRVGDRIQTYKTVATLENGKVDKGDIIPLSEVKVEEDEAKELTYNKYRKAVSFEDIQRYGVAKAIEMTDKALIKEAQKGLKADLFGNIKNAQKTVTAVGLQGAVAQAWGNIQTIFEDDGASTIVFVNPLDVADYLGEATITVQKEFGLNYLTNFLGADVAIISPQITKGEVYATAVDNLIFAYADINNGEAAREFNLITDETNVIGIRHDQTNERLTYETTIVATGLLAAERLDGVIKITIQKAATI